MRERAPHLCDRTAPDFFGGSPMVDIGRQLPATSASASATYLSGAEGPGFVVLALAEHEARASLVRPLVETGSIPNTIEAGRPVATAPAESGVLW